MDSHWLQEQCALGQEQLMRMEYLAAEQTLAAAEKIAWEAKDFDSLSRLYMPLQETRRQRRQRTSDGIIRTNLIARKPNDMILPVDILANIQSGTLLVAGWKTFDPGIQTKKLVAERSLYIDVFSAKSDISPENALIIILENSALILSEHELPTTPQAVMELWERIHQPYLEAAEQQNDPLEKMAGYRKAIEVDYACELAHQHLSDVAREFCKSRRSA
jgi:hypothetical protein